MTTAMKAAGAAIMKAIRVSEFGGPEVCKLLTGVTIPTPGPKQVLIQLKATGVNPVETYIVNGTHTTKPALPFTPGGDGAGTVSQIGDGVQKVQVDQRVFCFRSITGTYAEYTLVNESDVFPLPDSISFNQGAAVGVPYFTAARAMSQKAHAEDGDTVFIHGASGAVGLACCQMAQVVGLNVIGTAGTEAGLQLVLQNGAQQAFNHTEAGYMDKVMASANNGEGPDIVVEMLANVNLEEDMRIARFNGRIVIVGNRGTIEVNPRLAMMKELRLYGMQLFKTSEDDLAKLGSFLVAGLEAGWLKPTVGQTFPLAQAGDAQKEVIDHTSGTQGKIVLEI